MNVHIHNAPTSTLSPETDLEVVEADSMPLKALQVWWRLIARDMGHYIHSDKKLQKTINLQEAR